MGSRLGPADSILYPSDVLCHPARLQGIVICQLRYFHHFQVIMHWKMFLIGINAMTWKGAMAYVQHVITLSVMAITVQPAFYIKCYVTVLRILKLHRMTAGVLPPRRRHAEHHPNWPPVYSLPAAGMLSTTQTDRRCTLQPVTFQPVENPVTYPCLYMTPAFRLVSPNAYLDVDTKAWRTLLMSGNPRFKNSWKKKLCLSELAAGMCLLSPSVCRHEIRGMRGHGGGG